MKSCGHDECSCGPDSGTDGSSSPGTASGTRDRSYEGALAPIIDMDAHREKKRREKYERDLWKLFGWAVALAVIVIVVSLFTGKERAA